jgi:hypothetical protein
LFEHEILKGYDLKILAILNVIHSVFKCHKSNLMGRELQHYFRLQSNAEVINLPAKMLEDLLMKANT